MLKIKRVYDPATQDDGKRILVDRLWPRGLTKEDAKIDEWMKELSPSTELRTWFEHDAEKWEAFKSRFSRELHLRQEAIDGIVRLAKKGTVTLLYSSREVLLNNAVALKEYIEARMSAAERKKAA